MMYDPSCAVTQVFPLDESRGLPRICSILQPFDETMSHPYVPCPNNCPAFIASLLYLQEDCDDRFDTGDADFLPATFDPRCRVWFQDARESNGPIFTDPYQVRFEISIGQLTPGMNVASKVVESHWERKRDPWLSLMTTLYCENHTRTVSRVVEGEKYIRMHPAMVT